MGSFYANHTDRNSIGKYDLVAELVEETKDEPAPPVLNKTQLKDLAHISTNAIAKLVRDENVSLDTLEKICKALDCKIEDIMDFTEKEEC